MTNLLERVNNLTNRKLKKNDNTVRNVRIMMERFGGYEAFMKMPIPAFLAIMKDIIAEQEEEEAKNKKNGNKKRGLMMNNAN